MPQQANQTLWDYDITARFNQVGLVPAISDWRVDDLIAVVPVDPVESKSKYILRRDFLEATEVDQSDEDFHRAPGSMPSVTHPNVASSARFECTEIGPPAELHDSIDGARNQIDPDVMATSADLMVDRLGRKIFGMVNGLFVAGNFAGRTAAMAALAGGDSKDLSDADHNPVKSLIEGAQLARAGNAGLKPDQMTISETYLLKFRTHVGMLSKLGLDKSKDYISELDAIARLEDAVGLNVNVRRGRSDALWGSKILYHWRGGQDTEVQVPGTQTTVKQRIGGFTATMATSGRFKGVHQLRMCTAALFMEQIQALGFNVNGDPATWGVQVYQHNAFSWAVRAAASIDAVLTDATAGYLITAGY